MLALCSRKSLSCARGHVARLSVTNAVTSRRLHAWEWTRLPGVWGHKTQSLRLRTEGKGLQRSKTKLCSVGPRLVCVHPLSDHPLALHFLHRAASQHTGQVSPAGAALNRPVCAYSSQLQPITRILNERVDTGLFPLQEGSRRYGTTPENQVQKSPDQETEGKEAPQCAPTFTPSQQAKFKELYENPWTIPNFLCMARILLSPFLGYLIMEQYFHLSLGLFVLAGATDLLDGYIARNWPNQKSALGSALDPLADKILISVLYVSLTYAQLIPVPLTVLVICRDVALIAAVFYVRYKTVPPPVTLSKFFNPCYTTAQLKPTLISKFNTAIQLLLVAASLASPIFHYTDSVLLQSLWYVTALSTAASGYSYYHYGRKTVEVLNKAK